MIEQDQNRLAILLAGARKNAAPGFLGVAKHDRHEFGGWIVGRRARGGRLLRLRWLRLIHHLEQRERIRTSQTGDTQDQQQHADATAANCAHAYAPTILNIGTTTTTFPSHGNYL